LAPIIAEIINLSFSEGIAPNHWKIALVLSLLKKFGLDFMFENVRPISNLPFVAKSAEKATISCAANSPFPEYQSAYRKNHSTETALLKVQNDILLSTDRQEVTLLVLIDLSAAFDTIDHAILLETFEKDFGVTGNALKWLTSYLSERKQTILIKDHESKVFNLQSGVPADIREASTVETFKSRLKTFLFKRHFIFKYNSKFELPAHIREASTVETFKNRFKTFLF
jgi:hypothetical protein